MKKGITIHLKRMHFYAYHGVLPQEQTVGAEYIVSIKLNINNINNIILSDDINSTINYAEVCNAVNEEMKIKSKLLEHVCGRIIHRIFNDFPLAEAAEVEISKIAPPMKAQMQEVSVSIYGQRDEFI